MKLIRKSAEAALNPAAEQREAPWKVLVVDDEPDVRAITALNLRDFRFAGRPLRLIEASSAAEALALLPQHPDVAAALVDVVMETDDAGLKLVEAMRKQLGYLMTRIIIRTGQPGVAPERYVIDHFDIDDYKDKTELTAQRLYTTLRSALKAYRDLQTIELNRQGLEVVLEATPQLYQLQRQTLESFFEGVLTQVIALCKLTHSGLISTIDGLLTTLDGDGLHVRAGAGDLVPDSADRQRLDEVVDLCTRAVRDQQAPEGLRKDALIVPLMVQNQAIGFIYLEASEELTGQDRVLIQVMSNQCSSALENFRLHTNLRESYEAAIETLAQVAEFKDSSTGAHINRMAEYTRLIAERLGLPPAQCAAYAQAARLHDVGKVGIADGVLQKPGPLTEAERAAMRRHTEIGARILSCNKSLSLEGEVAFGHHERWDGSGYPQGLAGAAIPLVSRIVAVADVFDALVSSRPYKAPWSPQEAMAEIERQSGRGFDPAVVAAMSGLYLEGRFGALLASARA
jgi:response regulator RpfG family c-di-GMP phosphodiesterase